MQSNLFETILKDLEAYFQCPLAPDGNTCLIQLPNGLKIQFELDPQGNLVVGTKLGVIPPGVYRDSLLKESLKANGSMRLSFGTLGFTSKSNTLFLFSIIDNQVLNAAKYQTFLPLFIERATLWATAIEKGELPSLSELGASTKPNLFGLIH